MKQNTKGPQRPTLWFSPVRRSGFLLSVSGVIFQDLVGSFIWPVVQVGATPAPFPPEIICHSQSMPRDEDDYAYCPDPTCGKKLEKKKVVCLT